MTETQLGTCQECGSAEIEIMTRVTGFFSKVNSWNKGKLGELNQEFKSDIFIDLFDSTFFISTQVFTSIPSFLSIFYNVSANSLSSLGIICPNFSMTVTLVPNLLKTWANSKPIGPAPMTIRDAGSLSKSKILTLFK